MSCDAETFRRWFDFEKEVHRKVLASLSAVPPDKRAAPEFRKAVDLAAHIAGTRWFWARSRSFSGSSVASLPKRSFSSGRESPRA